MRVVGQQARECSVVRCRGWSFDASYTERWRGKERPGAAYTTVVVETARHEPVDGVAFRERRRQAPLCVHVHHRTLPGCQCAQQCRYMQRANAH